MKNRKVLLALIVIAFSLQFISACSRSAAPIDSPEYYNSVMMQMADSLDEEIPANAIDYTSSFYLYNFDDEPTAVFYQLKPVGYAIYDFARDSVLEYSKERDHPYYIDPEITYYYDGVFGYYVKTEEGFEDLVIGIQITP